MAFAVLIASRKTQTENSGKTLVETFRLFGAFFGAFFGTFFGAFFGEQLFASKFEKFVQNPFCQRGPLKERPIPSRFAKCYELEVLRSWSPVLLFRIVLDFLFCFFCSFSGNITTTLQRTTQRCTTQVFHNAIHISFFYSVIAVMPFPVFSASRRNFLHRTHRPSAFASIFPFATMVYCTKQQEICQESQRSDVATGNAGWPSQTQTQTQRCGALSLRPSEK